MDGPGKIGFNKWNMPTFPVPGLKKIWHNDFWNDVPGNSTFTFREPFKAVCREPITVYANADDSFKLSINGQEVLTG